MLEVSQQTAREAILAAATLARRAALPTRDAVRAQDMAQVQNLPHTATRRRAVA